MPPRNAPPRQDLAAAACASRELAQLTLNNPAVAATWLVAKSVKEVPGAKTCRRLAVEALRGCVAASTLGKTDLYPGDLMTQPQALEWSALAQRVESEMLVLASKTASQSDDDADRSMKRIFRAVSLTGLSGRRLSFVAETFEESMEDDWTDVYALTMVVATSSAALGTRKRRRSAASTPAQAPNSVELHRLVTYESVRVEDFDDEVRNRRPTPAALHHLREGMGVKHLTDGQLLYFVLLCCGVKCMYEQWVLDLDRHVSGSEALEANMTHAEVTQWHAERSKGVLACWPRLPHMRFSPLRKAAERDRIASTDPPRSGNGGGLQLLPAVEAATCGIAGRTTRSLSRRLSSPAVPKEAYEAAAALSALALACADSRATTARAMATPIDQLRATMATWAFPKKDFKGWPSGWDFH